MASIHKATARQELLPRRFVDLFSLGLGNGRPLRRQHKDADGARREWERGETGLVIEPHAEEEATGKSYDPMQRRADITVRLAAPEDDSLDDGVDEATHLELLPTDT